MSGRKGKVPSISMASVPNPRSRKWGTIVRLEKISGPGIVVAGPMTLAEAQKDLEQSKESVLGFEGGMVVWSQDWKGME